MSKKKKYKSFIEKRINKSYVISRSLKQPHNKILKKLYSLIISYDERFDQLGNDFWNYENITKIVNDYLSINLVFSILTIDEVYKFKNKRKYRKKTFRGNNQRSINFFI